MKTFFVLVLVLVPALLSCEAHFEEARSGLTGAPQVLPVHAAAARTRDESGAPTFDGTSWSLGVDAIEVYYPVPVIVGDIITEWSAFGRRDFRSKTSAQLQCVDAVDGLSYPVGPLLSDASSVPGYFVLNAHLEPPIPANEDCAWAVRVIGGFYGGDRVGNVNVSVMRGP